MLIEIEKDREREGRRKRVQHLLGINYPGDDDDAAAAHVLVHPRGIQDPSDEPKLDAHPQRGLILFTAHLPDLKERGRGNDQWEPKTSSKRAQAAPRC